jgi:hypothetical protein
MRVHPGRVLGLLMGLVILAVILFVPFTSSQTLFAQAKPLVSNLGSIQQSGSFITEAADYVLLISFILLFISGFVGVFPLGTGVLGVVGMAMFTVGPYLIYPGAGVPPYDAGFYLIWLAAVVCLAASFWHHGSEKVVVHNEVNVSSPAGSAGTQA